MKVGQLVADRYEIEELAGTGGMSSVFRARDSQLGRRVALKILHEQHSKDADYVERFRREARSIARLAHPNIVTLIDRGEESGRQYIVFEHVAGENLKQLVAREGPLPLGRALALTLQVARGLEFAHRHGIVHRDVKPQNVLIDEEGSAKVTDFGIARSLDRDAGLTQTGTLLGTSEYLSPEQARGEHVDERSDQYSLGVLLYELLTGDVPYRGDNLVAVAMRHLHDPVPSVRAARPDVPPRVEAIVARAMAKNPGERFPSTAALVAELEACLGTEVEEDTLAGAMPAPVRHAWRARPVLSPALVLSALAAVAVAVAIGFVLSDRGGVPVLGGNGEGGGAGTGATVRLTAVGDYDPLGDEREHPEAVGLATDGEAGTYWTTETYQSFTKPGVGLLLDARRPTKLSTLTIRTDTPGFTALVQGGDRQNGGFADVSGEQTVARTTRFELDTGGEEYRFYVVWITDPKGRAHLNEVRAR
jgi:eukaryotic-like serine/threonine-protein kinase